MSTLKDVLKRTTPAKPEAAEPATPEAEGRRRITVGFGDPDCPYCYGLGYVALAAADVPLGDARFGRAQPCVCRTEEMRHQRAVELQSASNMTDLRHKTFDTFQPSGIGVPAQVAVKIRAAYEVCRRFAAQPEKWLVLSGTVGTGKTHLALAIANQLLASGQPVVFQSTPDLLDYLRASFAPDALETYSERFENLRDSEVLIIDDLGTESPTPWALEKLYQLINHRYNLKLPTVITTNRSADALDVRIASRMQDIELVKWLDMSGVDVRGGKTHDLLEGFERLHLHRRQTFDTFEVRDDLKGEARHRFVAALQAAKEFAQEPKGLLFLAGGPGSGKTHLAAAIANQQQSLGQRAVLITYSDLMRLFRPASKRPDEERHLGIVDQLRTVDLLVLDDLSANLSTAGYFREYFFNLLNYRIDGGFATVITTAISPEEVDARLKARIFNTDLCQVHVLQADPYRGAKSARPRLRKES